MLLSNEKCLGTLYSDLSPKHHTEPLTQRATFFSAGKSGDWRNWFNDDQSKRMDEKFREKMDGSQLNVRYSFTTQSRSE